MLLFSDKDKDKEMSAGNKEAAADGGLENSDETEDPVGDRKEGKPELEVEDENLYSPHERRVASVISQVGTNPTGRETDTILAQ